MSRQGVSEKKVIMADVEPGEKTGVYYMPICNLPFGTSWQDLKDWLRVDCDVDHVELFQSSTSGWIRLRGEGNFNKAWSRLKKEYFRNRAIIASDKNRTESIKIKELVDSRVAQYSASSGWELAPGQSRVQDAALPQLRTCVQETASLVTSLGMDLEFGRFTPGLGSLAGQVAVMGYPSMPVLDPYTAMAGSYNASAVMRNHTLSYVPRFGYYETPTEPGLMPPGRYGGGSHYCSSQSVDSQLAGSHLSHGSMPYRSPSGTPTHARPRPPMSTSDSHQRSGYTAKEWCKVVVTSIQHRARQSEVVSWILHQIGEYSSAITALEIPIVEPKGRIRGHAFITLANPTAAEAAVRILDQKLFQGRVVSTRMASEGMADTQRFKASRESRLRHCEREDSKEAESPARQSDQDKSHKQDTKHKADGGHASSPLLASSNEQSPPHQTTGNTIISDGPVIAHGSSTRKPDKK